MASTFSSSSIHSIPHGTVPAPPTSHDLSLQSVPDVYVIPPEEEQDHNPPWCYFDAQVAKTSLATSPDMEALDVALSFFQQTDNRSPLFSRDIGNMSQETIVMPKRSASKLEDSPTRERGIPGRGRMLDSDSEIVEVVKVRRHEGISDVGVARSQTMKKSKTFRARATQAFRSIRNVGRSTRKFPSSGSYNHTENQVDDTLGSTFPRPTSPNITRRKSIQLSHFFSSTRGSRSTVQLVSNPPPSSSAPHVASSFKDSSFSARRPSPSLGDRTNTPEPRATLDGKKSFRKRISVLDLHRLFNPSSLNLASAPIKEDRDAPTTPRTPKRDSMPSSISRHPPRLPDPISQNDDDVFSGSGRSPADPPSPRPHTFHESPSRRAPSPAMSAFTFASGGLSSRSSRDTETDDEDDDMGVLQETSFEMRLDSLHFESLRFDPDEF